MGHATGLTKPPLLVAEAELDWLVATLGHVCATPRDRGSQGSDSVRCFPTKAACRTGPGRSPICSEGTTGRPASPGQRNLVFER